MKIAVIGAGQCDKDIFEIAEKTGFLLAQNNYEIVCGGLGGVMEAVCKGSKKVNGVTIGILPGDDPGDANAFVDHPIATGMGIARNIIIVRSARVVLAIDGKYGTLSEIAYALQLKKPVIGLKTWNISDNIIHCNSPEQAIEKVNSTVKLLNA